MKKIQGELIGKIKRGYPGVLVIAICTVLLSSCFNSELGKNISDEKVITDSGSEIIIDTPLIDTEENKSKIDSTIDNLDAVENIKAIEEEVKPLEKVTEEEITESEQEINESEQEILDDIDSLIDDIINSTK